MSRRTYTHREYAYQGRHMYVQFHVVGGNPFSNFHLCKLRKDLRLPARRTIQDFAVTADFCSMLWCRKHLMNSTCSWRIHIRIDSSPQYARDYCITEIDYIDLSKFVNTTLGISFDNALACLRIVPRLSPLQVLGSKATTTLHKFKALQRQLSLESWSAEHTCRMTATIVCDMGAESGLWRLPDLSSGSGLAFPHHLPMADADHAMHHVPELHLC